MKKIIYYSLIGFVSMIFLAACANDNYEEPNSGIEGAFLDSATMKPVPMPVPSTIGLKLSMYEKSRFNSLNTSPDYSQTPIFFFAKIDGTFKNTWMFQTDYLLTLDKINFFPIDTIDVKLESGKITHKDIIVVPFARIDTVYAVINQTLLNDTIATRELQVTFKMSRDRTNFAISGTTIMWNISPFVDLTTGNYIGQNTKARNRAKEADMMGPNLVQVIDLKKDYTKDDKKFNDPGNLELIKRNGNKIYVRVGISAKGTYNFSNVISVPVTFVTSEL